MRPIVYALFVLTLVSIGGFIFSQRAYPSLLSLASSSVAVDPKKPTFFITPEHTAPRVGEKITIEAKVRSERAINAVAASLRFSPEFFAIESISKEGSLIDLWTEETTIDETNGSIHWSGGSLLEGGFVGVGSLLMITVRPLRAGTTTVFFESTDLYAHDGTGRPIPHDTRVLSLEIESPTAPAVATSPKESAPSLSPDLNNDGRVSIADASIMLVQLFSGYSARYDLNRDGVITLADLAIVLAAR